MTENHPITPPPELIAKWAGSLYGFYDAVQWGADRQLEECVAWLDGYERDGWAAKQMSNDLRPKPPSLAEQAFAALSKIENNEATYGDAGIISKALHKLQQYEKQDHND